MNDPSSPSKADIEARLQGTTDAITARLNALQEEVATTGTSLWDVIRRNPLRSLGGALLLGLLLGFWLKGSRKKRLKHAHRKLLDRYIAALRDEVRASVAQGEDVGAAVQEALQGRAPLIVYTQGAGENGETSGPGFLRKSFDVIADTALALIAREALGSFLFDGTGDALGHGEEAAGAADVSDLDL